MKRSIIVIASSLLTVGRPVSCFSSVSSSVSYTSYSSMPKRKLSTTSVKKSEKKSASTSENGTKKAKLPSKKKAKSKDVAPSLPIPANYHTIKEIVYELRADRTAPVDSLGAEALILKPPEVSKDVSDFQVLMALMLSSQTKDAVVGAAIKGMQNGIKGGLTMQGVHKLSDR